MASEMLRVAIVAASLAWRDRIAALLKSARGLHYIGAAATLTDLGRLTPTPDTVIVDAPDTESLETLAQTQAPPMPLVILSDLPHRDDAVLGLLTSGAAILERDPTAEQLLAAVRAVAGGLVALAPAHVATLLGSAANADAPRGSEWIQPLTPRELQVLRMLSEGVPNKAIAADLQISEHTAKFHVSQILAKLGAESRTEAVAIGIRHVLVMV
jgi:DNA-binding NarL/FixJ family response regulator